MFLSKRPNRPNRARNGGREVLSEEEEDYWDEFYEGDEWPQDGPEEVQDTMHDGRPALSDQEQHRGDDQGRRKAQDVCRASGLEARSFMQVLKLKTGFKRVELSRALLSDNEDDTTENVAECSANHYSVSRGYVADLTCDQFESYGCGNMQDLGFGDDEEYCLEPSSAPSSAPTFAPSLSPAPTIEVTASDYYYYDGNAQR